MRHNLSILVLLLATSLPSCFFIRVRGDLDEFAEHSGENDELLFLPNHLALAGAKYDLDLDATTWKTEAVWTVAYAGADTEDVFARAQEAVLHRISREGGSVTSTESFPGEWKCEFELDGEPGEASVRVLDEQPDSARPHRLEIRWEEED